MTNTRLGLVLSGVATARGVTIWPRNAEAPATVVAGVGRIGSTLCYVGHRPRPWPMMRGPWVMANLHGPAAGGRYPRPEEMKKGIRPLSVYEK